MKFIPTEETLLVLEQAGYCKLEIQEALIAYSQAVRKFPELVKPSCKDFIMTLNSRCYAKRSKVVGSYIEEKIWVPGKQEIKKLMEEGYWQEVIAQALMDYLQNGMQNKCAQSQYGLFRAYLRQRIQLKNITIENWYPNPYLVNIITKILQVKEDTYPIFWDHFVGLLRKNDVNTNLIPRYFFNFIKANQIRILKQANNLENKTNNIDSFEQ